MAFIVETGQGIDGANSYASVEELDDYAQYRIDPVAYAEYTPEQKESALVIASSDWLDGQHRFRSYSVSETQGLHFPTTQDGLPAQIKTAAMKAALLQLQGLLMVDLAGISTTGEVQSESKSVGSLSKSVTYASGTSQRYYRVLPKDLTNLLRPYYGSYDGLGVVHRL